MSRIQKASDHEAQAAAWLVRLDAAPGAETVASWQRWMHENARHHAAFARLESSWRQMDGLRDMRPHDGTVDLGLLESFPGVPDLQAGSDANAAPGNPKRRESPTLLYSSIAVALAASLVSCLLVLAGWRFLTRPGRAAHRTAHWECVTPTESTRTHAPGEALKQAPAATDSVSTIYLRCLYAPSVTPLRTSSSS